MASHLRSGIWRAIVPHAFGLIFGGMPDLALRDMIAPIHRQAIGLVLADRSPQAPMALALEDCAAEAGIEAAFGAAFARRPGARLMAPRRRLRRKKSAPPAAARHSALESSKRSETLAQFTTPQKAFR